MNTIKPEHCYPSDMSDEQWAIIEPLLPVTTGAGRPTETDLRAVMNAIFYRTRTGCQWRYLPKSYPPTGTVYYHFRKWAKDGVWSRINNEVRIQERIRCERNPEPTGAIVDSQSVKTTEVGGEERGIDGKKRVKGRKRNIMTDTLGNLLGVVVNAANTCDRVGAKAIIDNLPDKTKDSIEKLWADGGYDGEPFTKWIRDNLHAVLDISLRPSGVTRFVVLPVRWVVERSLAWFSRYRCLSKDYERCPKSSEAVIYSASISTMLRRLT